MMRKSLTVLLAASLVTGALLAPSADAAKKKKKKPKKVTRTVTQTYQIPATGSGAGICLKPTNSCAETATAMNDKYVMLEITDTAGLPVYASYGQEMDGDLTNGVENDGTFCGKTSKPVKIEPGYAVTVFPWMVGTATCPGVATTGTVKLTFSNLP